MNGSWERWLRGDGGSQCEITLALVVVEKKTEVAATSGEGKMPTCRDGEQAENKGQRMENGGKRYALSGKLSGVKMPRRKTVGKILLGSLIRHLPKNCFP